MIAGLFWFAQAFSSAFGQAFVALAGDPLLIWLYATIAVISAIGGVGFSFTFAKLDAEEDALNAIGEGFINQTRLLERNRRSEKGPDELQE